jgi:branched-chain amino acid transport system permease protein
MSIYLLQIINGIGIGMLYFLMSVGLSIIFGLLGFVNFAHGAFFMLGAYICFEISGSALGFWWALILVPLMVGAFAWLMEKFLLRYVYQLPHGFHILLTLGVALVLQEAVIVWWGPIGKEIAPPALLEGVVVLGSFVYPTYRLFVIAFTALMALLLWWLLDGTRLGSIVRAGSESTEMVSLLGININRIISLIFTLGTGIAGLAGALAAPIRGAEPFMGVEALGIAFVVVVTGGMGSFGGALGGGLLIGIVQSLMSTIWPEGAHLMIYVAMAAVMLLRPSGLFGRG